jgi:hypothetical protein
MELLLGWWKLFCFNDESPTGKLLAGFKISGDYNGDIIWLMIGDYTTQYIGDYNPVGCFKHVEKNP